MTDPIELAVIWASVAALRRRAARQRAIAVSRGERSGEAAVALRIADVLARLADEFEGAAS